MEIYLVGGAVRDLLLGRQTDERDYLFFGDPDAFIQARPSAFWAGKDFPVVMYQGREFAPPRGPDLQADLAGRDLTINAMALGPDGRLHSHPQALTDLHARVLRPAGERAMAVDPVRVFRAARLAAELPDFTPHPDLYAAMRQVAAAGMLRDAAAERVGKELLRALAASKPSRFLGVLYHGRCLWPWFPELDKAHSIPAGPEQYHSGSVLSHTMQVMDAAAGDPLTVYLALCHDLGKTSTTPDLLPHHYGHENRGVELARQLAVRLRLSTSLRRKGQAAAELHMLAGMYPELRPGTRVDLLEKAHRLSMVDQLFALAEADSGEDHLQAAKEDLTLMLKVRLPKKDRNKGPESGEKLRLLRCQALGKKRL